MDVTVRIKQTICPMLSPGLAAVVEKIPAELLAEISELRIRSGQALRAVTGHTDRRLRCDGRPAVGLDPGYICTPEDLQQTMLLVSRNSLYAFEEELRQGFFTVAGGHRIGLAGQAIVKQGELIALKNVGALNVRLAREVIGAADRLVAYVVSSRNKVWNTLIISPPRCGKTTVLRDLIRQLSSGVAVLKFEGVSVGVVDERSEIAACREGVPTINLGPRADVLDGCPKAIGLLMLIRSMAPRVVATDELGREADAVAVREALHAGVSVLATVHGRDVADVGRRPYVGELIAEGRFDRYVLLGDSPQAGTVEQVLGAAGEVLFDRSRGASACG